MLIYFLGLMILDFSIRPRLPPTCALPRRLLMGLARLVNAIFLAACEALAYLFLRILAPLTGFNLALQVEDLATILPFLGPDTHLKPVLSLPPDFRSIWLMPSAMAETQVSGAMSCGTVSCACIGLMALGVFGVNISDSFIWIFMDVTVPDN